MKQKTFTIRDIVKLTEWKDVKKAYLYYYGKKGLKGLDIIFESIKTFRKQKPKDKNELIEVMVGGWAGNEPEEDRGYGVHTVMKNKDAGYSLSFRKWREITNIPIQQETIRRYKFHEIICHFLWEITFYGYDEKEIGKTGKEIFGRYKEAVKDLDSKGNKKK